MNTIEASTCVRFVARNTQADHLVYRSDSEGCSSKLGRMGKGQFVNLGTGCFKIGIIMHELIHALGYTHMHNHINRDQKVKIYKKNIQTKHLKNFDQVNSKEFGNFGTAYDYESIMHYGVTAFAKDPKYFSIKPLDSNYVKVAGQREKLSQGDKKRINNMYNCRL